MCCAVKLPTQVASDSDPVYMSKPKRKLKTDTFDLRNRRKFWLTQLMQTTGSQPFTWVIPVKTSNCCANRIVQIFLLFAHVTGVSDSHRRQWRFTSVTAEQHEKEDPGQTELFGGGGWTVWLASVGLQQSGLSGQEVTTPHQTSLSLLVQPGSQSVPTDQLGCFVRQGSV